MGSTDLKVISRCLGPLSNFKQSLETIKRVKENPLSLRNRKRSTGDEANVEKISFYVCGRGRKASSPKDTVPVSSRGYLLAFRKGRKSVAKINHRNKAAIDYHG